MVVCEAYADLTLNILCWSDRTPLGRRVQPSSFTRNPSAEQQRDLASHSRPSRGQRSCRVEATVTGAACVCVLRVILSPARPAAVSFTARTAELHAEERTPVSECFMAAGDNYVSQKA